MPTRKQHYVPQIYLKAWETRVETKSEPEKKFDGVYYFGKSDDIGDGSTRETILWKPNLYTIDFQQLYMAKGCPKVYNYFVDEVFNIMRTGGPQPVYGKFGYSVIRTRRSVQKHLFDINNWKFYYDDGKEARTAALLNRFKDLRCYLLEDSFNKFFENRWENVLRTLIDEVKTAAPISAWEPNRKISEKAAKDMIEFFFMMLCRNPQFDAMGVYSWMKNFLGETFSGTQGIDELMEGIWLNDLYKMFYKETKGFYKMAVTRASEGCHIVLYEASPDAGNFITSDNPVFQYADSEGINNVAGFCFPISPDYVLLIRKGNMPISMIDYRIANSQMIRKLNQLVDLHSNEIIVSKEKKREKFM